MQTQQKPKAPLAYASTLELIQNSTGPTAVWNSPTKKSCSMPALISPLEGSNEKQPTLHSKSSTKWKISMLSISQRCRPPGSLEAAPLGSTPAAWQDRHS